MAQHFAVPGRLLERRLTTAVALVILLGTLTAVAAARRSDEKAALEAETPSEVLPLAGWTIVVDPGHGGYDGGARARESGIWEKHINLSVALEVEKSLVKRGAQVVLTRRTDVDLCTENRPASLTKKRQDMEARIETARQAAADMVLSIHMNEYRARSQSGPQVFYREGSDAGRLLAGCLQSALIAGLSPKKERVAMAGDYFILQLSVPSALVECGFLSNAEEEKKLLTPDYQAKIGEAVAEGAVEYVTLTRRLTGATEQTPPAAAR